MIDELMNFSEDNRKRIIVACNKLFKKQWLHSDIGNKYEFDILINNTSYVKNLFESLGYDLVVKTHMIGILPNIDMIGTTSRGNKPTCFLLALLHLYHMKMGLGECDENRRVESSLDEIWSFLNDKEITLFVGQSGETALRKCFEEFKENNIITDCKKIQDEHEGVSYEIFKITSAIEHIINKQDLENFIKED